LRGLSFKIVAPSGLYLSSAPTTGLIVAKDSPYKSGADLNGKTFSAASLRDLDEIAIRGWVDQNGGDSTTLKFIELPNAAVPQALSQHRIDAAALVNPTLFEALSSGDVKLLGRAFDSIGHRFMIAVWFCSPAYGQRNPDVLRRFAQAFHEAATFTNSHHDQTVDLLANFSHIKPEVIGKMVRSTTGLTLSVPDLQPEIDAAARYKMIDHAFSATELLAA
jgi:NitT/TauT family transport system substrate-binding protein